MKEKINALVKAHCEKIRAGKKNFESIFEVMFSLGDRILAEKTDGYRIKKYSYQEVKEEIINKAYALSLIYGLDGHAFVGLDMDNDVSWIVSFWAIIMSGNKPLLINNRHPQVLTERILKTLNVRYVIGLSKPLYNCEYISYEELNAFAGKDFKGNFEDEIALVTSATSLNEKICIYTGLEIAEQILNSQDILRQNKLIKKHYDGSIKLLAFLPMYHIFGLMATYFWFTLFGRTLVFLKDYSPDTIIKTIKKHKVTHLLAVPLLWHTIEDQVKKEVHLKGEKTEKKFYKGIKISTKLQNLFPRLGKRIARRLFKEVNDNLFGKSVIFCISGGSYIKDSTLQLFNALGYPLHNGYGMTEIGISSVELRKKVKERNLNSIGRPFSSIRYKIEDNILWVKGKTICPKMYIDGKLIINDDWFETKDIAHVDKKGNYYIDGRLGDVIIGDNGENINPDLLEKHFNLHYIKRFSILGIKKNNTEIITMVVEPLNYLPKSQFKLLYEEIMKQNALLPLINQVKEFYYTFNSISSELAIKVSRQYLKRGLDDNSIVLSSFDEYKDLVIDEEEVNEELVKGIKEIFEEILGQKDIEIDKHFIFDLGGTSLDYFSLISRLNARFGVKLRLDDGKCCYTIRQFAKEITNIM